MGDGLRLDRLSDLDIEASGLDTFRFFRDVYIYMYIYTYNVYIYIDRFRIHGILGLGSGVRVIAGRTAQGFEFWESVKRSLACCFPPTWI